MTFCGADESGESKAEVGESKVEVETVVRPAKRRRKMSQKKLFVMKYGGVVLYGSCLAYLVDEMNKIYPSGDVSLNTLRCWLCQKGDDLTGSKAVRGVELTRFKNASPADWSRVEAMEGARLIL